MREEELKNTVATDFFEKFDCDRIVGSIDFAVKLKRARNALDFQDEYLLWAEAKIKPTDIAAMLAQLVLTIGKARAFDNILPPPFLGCFDCEKIAFVPYADIQDIFYQSDFNWKVAPSDHDTREFRQIYAQIKKIIDEGASGETYLFDFGKDEKELKQFISANFVVGKLQTTKTHIDKNNFIIIYNKWLETVKPTIAVDWDIAKKNGILDGDFYLADLLSRENETLKEKLFVLLKSNHYELDRVVDSAGFFSSKNAQFKDSQKAHAQFWAKYERPPLEEYWDYIIERRDLLVPQDVRERKGSFFTPRIWVELSQKYIADALGKDWQDEYYVWDCAAGTGNLLAGLTNKYNIWASTLDKADVEVMKDRIHNGANLLDAHVFQFDFLNDDFTKLPQGLQDIINDPEKRKKLVIYINPPYAEVSTIGGGKAGVNQSNIHAKYTSQLGTAGREVYSQFLTRIYHEIDGCVIAEFSKLKILQGPAFEQFRSFFKPMLKKMFVVPANTFDNVKGKFPIGFFIWDTNNQEDFAEIIADVYNSEGNFTSTKSFSSYEGLKSINDWIISTRNIISEMNIGFISCKGSDFQNTNFIFILNDKNLLPHPRGSWVTDKNIIEASIYYSVRHCIEATWLNDRDQFLYPNDGWKTDDEFQNDCLAYTLFNNNIQSKYGANHWIPFTENDVNSRDKFASRFMTDFIAGKIEHGKKGIQAGTNGNLFPGVRQKNRKTALRFSAEAQAVFEAGKSLWRYYHAQTKCNVNASLYDIREHFQGRNDKGKMNNKSDDPTYTALIGNLRSALKKLARKIEPKVYEYGFLR
ncbi:MAG: hypothetical protein FWH15_03105 [Betaproteobacteria bacterium]|nr:hypothetical protein [Betaproteobacteria bacterium]